MLWLWDEGSCRNIATASAAPAHSSVNTRVCVFVPLFVQNHPFVSQKLITHMQNKIVPQAVMAEKTYKSL